MRHCTLDPSVPAFACTSPHPACNTACQCLGHPTCGHLAMRDAPGVSKAGQYGRYLTVSRLLWQCINPPPSPTPRRTFSRRPNLGPPASFNENTVGGRYFHVLQASSVVHRLTQGVGGPESRRAILRCPKCCAPDRVLRGARPQPSRRRVAQRGLAFGKVNETDCN